MLAEYLGSHGYATAGFVANAQYCSYDTGLSRGFTHYEDYLLEETQFPSNVHHCRGSSQEPYRPGLRQDAGPLYSLQEFLADLFELRDPKRCRIDQSRVP